MAMNVNNERCILDKSVSCLRGVGEKRLDALLKLGVCTVGDVLRLYPRAYQNRGDTKTLYEILTSLTDGESGVFSSILTVSCEPSVRMIRRGMVIMKLRAFDETGAVEITYFNQQYLRDSIHTGDVFRFFGRFTREKKRLKLAGPITEPCGEDKSLPGIVPVYPLTASLTQKFMAGIVAEALRISSGELCEFYPPRLLSDMRLPTYSYTVKNIHFPESEDALSSAKRRLSFDELYLMFLSMARGGGYSRKKNTVRMSDTRIGDFTDVLPFEMTGAQKRCIGEIVGDMAGEHLMNRILTGDVGSGKTAVAEAAAYAAVKNGYRVAVMVPTEILARQHYDSFCAVFGALDIRVELLTGSSTKREREIIKEGLTDCVPGKKTEIIIGTHALLSDDVEIARLGLAVIDEQHRFGVMQRAALLQKAERVHSLIMSATPIPRTLTLAAYGTIDVSRIDEMPAGRQKTDTFIVTSSYRERLNAFIKKQADAHHQTYVVCPAIEETKQIDDAEEMSNLELIEPFYDTGLPLISASAEADYLASHLPEVKIGLVHGKQKSAVRDKVMREFESGDLDVLVSTTVIEVGVNVPNATLMIVNNAERFGLSQLHQLRGRVGRGGEKSYFVLVSDTDSEEAKNRLNALKNTTNGFEIAEYDLMMRGPGDFFGDGGVIKQHGAPPLHLAATCCDTALIERASYYARMTNESDPALSLPENKQIRRTLGEYGERKSKTVN